MKMQTSELTGSALDWAVAKCEGLRLHKDALLGGIIKDGWWASGYYADPNQWIQLGQLRYSTSWAQGGPIIERENIDVFTEKGTPESWFASVSRYQNGERLYGWRIHKYGPTPLIAAMRTYVASRLGSEVEIPEGL